MTPTRSALLSTNLLSNFSADTPHRATLTVAVFLLIVDVNHYRENEVDIFKETMEICNKSFTWLIGMVLALMNTDTGKAFFDANYPVIMTIVLIKFLSFLTMVSATITQIYKKNLFPLIVMLLLESVASLLALSSISRSTAWTGMNLWLGIFVLFCFVLVLPS